MKRETYNLREILFDMKKIKSLFRKIKSQKTIKTYQQPLLITILTLLLINLLLIITAAIVGVNIDPEYFDHDFLKALVHFFSCMLSANTVTKLMEVEIVSAHFNIVILSIVVIAVEMILFSGAIIATLTAAIRNYIDKKSKAKGKIDLNGHFVILNWNSKVPDVIYNLMLKNYKGSVIILSNKSKEFVDSEIGSLISSYKQRKKKKVNLIIKEGNPLLHGDLEDISIDKASKILIMSREDMAEGDDENISNYDLMSLKTVLAVGSYDISEDCNIVIETDSESTRAKIENLAGTLNNLKNKSIIPVSFNRKIGQIIAQTMIEPLMANIYLELLSYEGVEFYSYDRETVEEYLVTHSCGIPIIKYDRLFVLADDETDLHVRRAEKSSLSKVKRMNIKEVTLDINCSIFVIGDNKKGAYIRENLELATIGYGSSFKVFSYNKNENDKLIADIKNTTGPKKVLILSDDTVDSDSYDANVFVTLIALQTAFVKRNRHELSFVTELLDSKNINSINDFNIKNAIVSNRMMSLLLSQLCLNKDSKKFFDGLLTADTEEGGDYFDIIIERVGNMVNDDVMEFSSRAELIQSFYVSFNRKMMLLGYIKDDVVTFLPKHQDDKQTIQIGKDDSFIFIKY